MPQRKYLIDPELLALATTGKLTDSENDAANILFNLEGQRVSGRTGNGPVNSENNEWPYALGDAPNWWSGGDRGRPLMGETIYGVNDLLRERLRSMLRSK